MKILKGIAILIIIAIIATLCLNAFGIINIKGWYDEHKQNATDPVGKDEDAPQANNKFGTILASNSYADGTTVRMYSAPMQAPANTLGVTKQLTAVIEPNDAPNKAVDWSIAWASGGGMTSQDVENYVTVTPTSDGSLTANVTAKQAFMGSKIIITVTTREGNYEATCMVTFVGEPSEIEIEISGHDTTTMTDGTVVYLLGSNNNYTFDLALDNVFGSVGTGFDNYSVSLTGVGHIVVDDCTLAYTIIGTTMTTWGGSEHNINLSTLTSSHATASIVNKDLKITTRAPLSAYYGSFAPSPTGMGSVYEDKFVEMGANSYFKATVTTDKGLSKTFCFLIDSQITGVSINNSAIQF